jgi:hypothetical protein
MPTKADACTSASVKGILRMGIMKMMRMQKYEDEEED